MVSPRAEERGKGFLERKIGLLEKGCTFAASLALVAMIAIIAFGTLSRYFLGLPVAFVDEYSGYLLVVMGFLAMVLALKRNAHITVDIVQRALPEQVRGWVDVGAQCIGILIAAVLFWLSLRLFYENYATGMRASTIMETPLWIPQLFIPFGWAVFILFAAVRIKNQMKSIRKPGKGTIR
jgi:TRAP-type C4-dicarboxylate transport system permease small subunit